MSDLAKKLGLKPGQVVHLHSAPPDAAALVKQESPEGVTFTEKLGRGRYDLILWWPKKLATLGEHFVRHQRFIKPDGAVWVVMPKKAYARERGIDFTWEQMQAAGLRTDMVDNKVASVTETDYGTRWVIRKERREKHAAGQRMGSG